jgi:hypothetical protein
VASVYAQGLRSPDGLAFSPSGLLYVAQERAGLVSQIDPTGSITTVVDGLASPEGITFDDAGNLYVVEDTRSGRLLQVEPDGKITTLASGLEAPEGVAWTPGGTLYVTESNSQFANNPLELRTHVTRVSPGGQVSRIITDTAVISGTSVAARSYAGLTLGPDSRLYVTNELSGQEITRTVVLIPGVLTATMTFSTTDSVFVVDPQAGERTLLSSGLISPEGLRFSSDDSSSAQGRSLLRRFPLYVAEEDVGDGQGRLSVVGADGLHQPLCTGFMSLEDVALDAGGNLYLSEDKSGLIIRIAAAQIGPSRVTIGGPEETIVRHNTGFTATVSPSTTTQPVTYTWQASEHGPRVVTASLNATTAFSWTTPGRHWVAVTAANQEGAVSDTQAITVHAPVVAAFHGAPTTGVVPLTVVFTNTSTGAYDASLWEFGDGNTGTSDSPTYSYPEPGTYTVALTVSGPGGRDSETKRSYITARYGAYLPLVFRAW